MRVFMMLASLLMVPLPVAAQDGPVCEIGCPCGNTCIQCSDTCRVGGGSASSQGGSNDNVTILIVMGVVLAVVTVGSLLAAAYFMSKTPTDYKREKSYSPTVYCKDGDIGCLVPLLSP